MHPKKFTKQLPPDSLVEAIRAAEQKTSGQIRVFISHRAVADAVESAQKEFVRQRLGQSPERNGVLIFVAPRSHKFAVIGDEGIHAKCGEVFWQELAAAMTDYFRKSQFTEGIIHAVERAGEMMAGHFPRTRGRDT